MKISRAFTYTVTSILTVFATFMFIITPSNDIKPESDDRVMVIYNKIAAATGEINEVPPLTISDSSVVNAYASTNGITINTGLIDITSTDDEIALVLAHEMAHVMLGHIYVNDAAWTDIARMEAQADKMGALYMMKAGYDVCKGRELYLKWMIHGDYLFGDHPNYAYRYTQLNVNCGKI